jgi:signal transduction histidine kinase
MASAGPLFAAFALGANVLGTALLVLFNPHSRSVRWFSLFLTNLSTWLALLTVESVVPWTAMGWAHLHASIVHCLPATFLAFALVRTADRPAREVGTLVAVAVASAPFMGPRLFAHEALPFFWQVAGWTAGSVLLWRARTRFLADAQGAVGRRAFSMMLAVPPLVITGMLFWRGGTFFFRVLPLITVVAQFLTFVAVVRARFQEIEVRALRRGELAADAAERERLTIVGELASSLAHEIRNPLAGVRSLLQRLLEEDVDEARRRRYAEVAIGEVGRVERIVGDLLALSRRSRPDAAALTQAPLGDVVDEILMLVAARCRRERVTLAQEVDAREVPVPREPVAQALLNLLLNAIRQTPAGRRVTLLARAERRGVELVVRDEGPGVAAAERERIFDPFYSTTGGTGLGLAVVKRVVADMGWRVSVGDAPGGGAEFRLQLPRAETHVGGFPEPGLRPS